MVQVDSEQTKAFYGRSATELGVDKALAEIIETRLEPALREQFHRLLSVFDSALYNLVLTGKPTRFTTMTFEERTRYLESWRDRLARIKKTGLSSSQEARLFLILHSYR